MSEKEIYITIPNKGDYELNSLLSQVNYLRKKNWIFKTWKSGPALVNKKFGSKGQYTGQPYDPEQIELVPNGWTQDHCEICSASIGENPSLGETEGFNSDYDWICKSCHQLFIEPADIQPTIYSLKKSMQ